MRLLIEPYMKYCRGLMKAPNTRYWIEGRWSFEYLIPGGFGTADFTAWDGKKLEVVDAKFGQKVVSAYRNPQLGLYAASVRDALKITPEIIRTTIVQPRAQEPITSYDWSYDELGLLELSVLVAASYPNTVKAGDHCEWCPVRVDCAEKKAYDAAEMGFRPVD